MAKKFRFDKLKREEKFTRNERLGLMFDLINSFRIVKSPSDTANFLQDLLTKKELYNLSVRLGIAKLLISGKTHEQIVKDLHCSFATVAKVGVWLSEGGAGFKKVISKLPKRYEFPKNLPPIPIEFQLPQVLMTIAQYGLANNQQTKLDKFLKGVGEKSETDKSIREELSEEFMGRKKRKNTTSLHSSVVK